MKKYWNILFAVLFAVSMATPLSAGTSTPRGVIEIQTDQTTVSDGTYSVYVDLRYYKRTDIRVTQDGGSGTISFAVFASWEPGGGYYIPETGLTYDDIGTDFYGAATWSSPVEKLIDNGEKLKTASWMKIVFTVAGASADASYQVIRGQITPRV